MKPRLVREWRGPGGLAEVELHSTEPGAIDATRATLESLPDGFLLERDGRYFVPAGFVEWAAVNQGYVKRAKSWLEEHAGRAHVTSSIGTVRTEEMPAEEFVAVVMVDVSLDEWEQIRDISMAGPFLMSLYAAVEKVLGKEAVEKIRDKAVGFQPVPAASLPMPLEARFHMALFPKAP